jgi:hypothetical protein
MRVRELETTVLLPFEPLASTVIRTIRMRIRRFGVEDGTRVREESSWVSKPMLQKP